MTVIAGNNGAIVSRRRNHGDTGVTRMKCSYVVCERGNGHRAMNSFTRTRDAMTAFTGGRNASWFMRSAVA